MTDLPIGRGQPRREAALRWLSWRWRGVSRPEGEVAAACGRLPLHVATRRPGRRWARCSCGSRRCTMWRRPCGPGCLGRVRRRRARSCVRGGDLCHTGLTMEGGEGGDGTPVSPPSAVSTTRPCSWGSPRASEMKPGESPITSSPQPRTLPRALPCRARRESPIRPAQVNTAASVPLDGARVTNPPPSPSPPPAPARRLRAPHVRPSASCAMRPAGLFQLKQGLQPYVAKAATVCSGG